MRIVAALLLLAATESGPVTPSPRAPLSLLIALGFIGVLVGLWLARLLGLPELFTVSISGTRFPILRSIIGSALFVAIISFIARSRR